MNNTRLKRTIKALSLAAKHDTWVIPQSGGKDSRATAQITLALIADGQLAPPQRVVFYMADTLMEYRRFWEQAQDGLDQLVNAARVLGIETHSFITHPIPQDDFFVRIVGRGFAPPTANMRSCTDRLKIIPPRKILRRMGWSDAPVFLGVRYGESARRDRVLSCTMGGECGPDYQYRQMSKSRTQRQRVIAPILEWKTCDVWDWLTLFAPNYGFDNAKLAEVYGPDGDLRYGCWTCPLIYHDCSGAYLAQDDASLLERVRWATAMFRPGGAAWRPENREKIENGNGRLVDGRLSIPFCQRLFLWLDQRGLLLPWQRDMIQAAWDWRESLPTVQKGLTPLELWGPSPLHISQVRRKSAEHLAVTDLLDDWYHGNILEAARLVAPRWPRARYVGQLASGKTLWASFGSDRADLDIFEGTVTRQ